MVLGNSTVSISGKLRSDTALRNTPFPSEIINLGTISVTGNIENFSDTVLFANDSLGHVVLNGSGPQELLGDELNFYDLEINNAAGIALQSDISVNDTLLMSAGSIDLNGRILEMVDSIGEGMLVNETETNRVFGSTGFIQTTRDGNDGGNLAGLGLRLDSSAIGRTTVRRGHSIQSGPGDGSIERYFVVEPTFSPIGVDSVEVNYFDAELAGISELDLDIYVSADSAAWRRQDAQNSPMSNLVFDSVEISSYEFIVTLAKSPCNVPPAVNIIEDTMYVCAGDSVLIDTQLPTNGYQFIWSTGDTDSVIYESATNSIDVIAIDNRGCVGYDTVQVIWSPNPYAEITVPNNCLNDTTWFANNDTVVTGNTIAEYHWDFGDLTFLNDTSAHANPTYIYGDSGVFDVLHWVVNDKGCIDSANAVVQISNNPVAQFSFNDNCADSSVLFLDLSSSGGLGPAYGIASYDWDFGNASTSTSSSPPSQFYSSSGGYPVTLIVRNSRGCFDTVIQSITIHPNPTVDFSGTQVCGNEATEFNNLSTDATSQVWNLGNGTTTSALDPIVNYGLGGEYTVVLTSFSAFGCTDSTSQLVFVDTVPDVSFTFNNTCAGDTVLFTNTSTNYFGVPSCLWNFGDGLNSGIENPNHLYVLDGLYPVQLVLTSPNGCVDTSVQTITVFPLPNAGFTVSDDCADSTLSFSNSSLISSGVINYEWDFGDGGLSTAINPFYAYATFGSYYPQLVAISDQGCRDTVDQSLTVFENPTANLGGLLTTCGSSLSLDANNLGSSYLWNDMTTNQTLSVFLDGNYWVSITSPDGCEDSDTVSVTLNVAFNPDLGIDTTVCDSIELTAYTPGGTFTWNTMETDSAIWVQNTGTYFVDVVDQNSCAGTDTITLVVNYSPIVELGNDTTICSSEELQLDTQNPSVSNIWNNGVSGSLLWVDSTFDYHVLVTSTEGCATVDSIQVVVNPNPTFSLGADTSVCDQLSLSVAGLSTYLWSTGDIDSLVYLNSSGTFWLEGGNSFGCFYRDSITAEVFDSPNTALGNDTTLCFGQSLMLNAGNADHYNWNTSDTIQLITVDSAGLYTVFVSSGICNTTDSINVEVDSLWSVSLGGNQVICENEVLTLYSSQTGLTNQWYAEATGFLGSGPTLEVSDEGIYWVITTNSMGCFSSDTIFAEESENPIISDFLVATEINLGDTVQFVTVTTDSISSYYWNFGDGTYDTLRHPYHEFFFIDTFDVMLIVSNGFCADTLIKQVIISPGKSDELPFEFPTEDDASADIENVWVYPNPTMNDVAIEIALKEENEVEIELFDLYSRLVFSERITGKSIRTSASLQGFSAGMYFYSIRVGLEKRVIKILKQ